MTMHCLLVDDSFTDRKLFLHGMREGESVKVDEASNAIDALKRLEERRYDAIVLDVRMPGEDGFHVLHEVRERFGDTGPIVLMWSSSDHEDDISRAYALRANLFFRKPDTLAEMTSLTRTCMGIIHGAAGRLVR